MKFSNFISLMCASIPATFSPKLFPIRNNVALLLFSLLAISGMAQPTVLGTQLANGSYATYDLTAPGTLFKQFRLQASSSAAVSTRNWEFATGNAGTTNYTTNWRPYTGGNTLSSNTFIPTSFANGAKYNTGSGGASGLLPAITAGNYYTFNVSNNAAADNVMQLLETSFNPVALSSATVIQSPAGANVLTSQSPVITVTTASAPSAGENVFVRYTTNAFTSSTLVQLSFTGAVGTATIPAQTAGTVVAYYIYSSNKTLAQINSDVATNGQSAHDMATLNLNTNGGGNYNYTVTSNNILVTSTGGTTSATYATLASANCTIRRFFNNCFRILG
jgi:trimeric autotransporter adhesin